MGTVYIAPAFTEIGSQCRIYQHPDNVDDAKNHYWQRPGEWREIALMNSRGRLVCCEPGPARDELIACEPLMGGLVIHLEE